MLDYELHSTFIRPNTLNIRLCFSTVASHVTVLLWQRYCFWIGPNAVERKPLITLCVFFTLRWL